MSLFDRIQRALIRAGNRNLTPVEGTPIPCELLLDDLTPPPETYVSPDKRPIDGAVVNEWTDEPTRRIER